MIYLCLGFVAWQTSAQSILTANKTSVLPDGPEIALEKDNLTNDTDITVGGYDQGVPPDAVPCESLDQYNWIANTDPPETGWGICAGDIPNDYAVQLGYNTVYQISLSNVPYTLNFQYLDCHTGGTFPNFYCSDAEGVNDVLLTFDSGFWIASGEAGAGYASLPYNEAFPSGHWLMPHHKYAYCTVAVNEGIASDHASCMNAFRMGFFVSNGSGSSYSLPSVDMVVPSGETWAWTNNASLSFASATDLIVEGVLTLGGSVSISGGDIELDDGTLIAVGTSFAFSGGGLIINGGATIGDGTTSGTLTIPSAGVSFAVGSSLTIKSNQTVILTSDLVIPSGATVTVEDDAVLKFGSDDQIQVYGTLNLHGTSDTHRATVTASSSSWDGITFNSGSSGSLEYADVNSVNAYSAVIVTNAAVTIENSEIDNPSTSNAIYVQSSSASAEVTDSYITGSWNGVVFTSSAGGGLGGNEIYVEGNAISAFYEADPYLRPYPYHSYGYNELGGENKGITAGYEAYVHAGTDSYAGSNQFCSGANYDAHAYEDASVVARKNYWPSGSPNVSGDVDAANVLGASACTAAKQGLVPYASIDSVPAADPDDALDDRISEAIDLMFRAENAEGVSVQELFSRAERLLKEVRSERSGTRSARAALVALFRLARLQGIDALRQYFEEVAGTSAPEQATALSLLVQAYQYWGDTAAARAAAERLTMLFPDRWYALYARLSIAEMNAQAGDYSAAAEELRKGVARDEREAERLLAAWALLEQRSGQSFEYDVGPKARTSTVEDSEPSDAPFTLAEVYPNPFNPSTEIRFELRERFDITVAVYDMLGREVDRLMDRALDVGSHSVTWDASDQASGTYFVVIRTEHVSRSIPVVLLR